MTPTGRDIGRIADCPSSIYYGLTLVEYKHMIIMWLNPEYRDIEVEYELKDLPHPEGRPRALHSELLLITEVIKTNYYDNTWSPPKNPVLAYKAIIGLHHYQVGVQAVT